MNENETENNMAPVPAFNHPLDWIRIFGPGAVIASLTIGSGELIFSTRGGALFGYPLLWIFLVVCILKWILVYSGSRHLILSGVHPIQRWMDLPGPRGWLPLTFLILAIISFPIWVSFHAGTLGTLLNALTPSADGQDSYAYYLWGALLSGGVLALILSGSYQRLERIQLILVCTMLAGVTLSLFMLGPVWLDLLSGLIPQKIAYPNWIDSLEAFRNRPLAVEIGTYVGVIGGGAYDYLAYMSYLREKKWGQAGKPPANNAELIEIEKHIDHPNRRWLRAPMIDCAISFLLIFIFSTVFLACGKIVLGSQQMVPSGTNLLTFQAAIVNSSFPWMKSFYFVGAFLAMFGTLYGTIEVAPAILKEIQIALGNPFPDMNTRKTAVLWTGIPAIGILVGNFLWGTFIEGSNPPSLVAVLTPANLFTGVLACGIICLLNPWMDRKYLRRELRMKPALVLANYGAGILFLIIGLTAGWRGHGWLSLVILIGTLGTGWLAAIIFERKF